MAPPQVRFEVLPDVRDPLSRLLLFFTRHQQLSHRNLVKRCLPVDQTGVSVPAMLNPVHAISRALNDFTE